MSIIIKEHLVNLVRFNVHLAIVLSSSQQHSHLLAPAVVVSVTDAKVRKNSVFQRLQTDFRITEDYVVLVVGDGPPVGLQQREILAVGEGEDEAVSV
jgi:hypothetical protein